MSDKGIPLKTLVAVLKHYMDKHGRDWDLEWDGKGGQQKYDYLSAQMQMGSFAEMKQLAAIKKTLKDTGIKKIGPAYDYLLTKVEE